MPARSRWAATASSSRRATTGGFCFPRSRSNTAGTGKPSSATAASRPGSAPTNGRRGRRSRSSPPRSFQNKAAGGLLLLRLQLVQFRLGLSLQKIVFRGRFGQVDGFLEGLGRFVVFLEGDKGPAELEVVVDEFGMELDGLA